VAGGHNGAGRFTGDAYDEISHYSGGIPRLINILCDRVMLIGYVTSSQTIDGRIVREAIRDIEAPEKNSQSRHVRLR
jgi:general secretion pathway protein A